MTKRSRKSAFGKANVVRRSSLKTTPVFARDSLSIDRSTLRKSVRTTLMVGTALGAAFMTVTMFGEQANAAVACSPGPILASPANYTGDQNPGIYCTATTDLTVTTTGGDLGPNAGGGDGSGLQIAATPSTSSTTINVNNGDTIGNKNSITAVGANGIEVTVNDTGNASPVDTVNITNTGQIGTSAAPIPNNGIFVSEYVGNPSSGDITFNGFITNSGAIFDNTSSSIGIGGSATAKANYSSGDPTVHMTIINTAPVSTSHTAISWTSKAYSGIGPNLATTAISNTGALTTTTTTNTGYGIFARSIANDGVTANTTIDTASVLISNTGAVGTSTNAFGTGLGGLSFAHADAVGKAANGTGGVATATTTITNTGALFTRNEGIYGEAVATARGSSSAAKGTGKGGSATATVFITNGGAVTAGLAPATKRGIDGQAYADASGSAYTAIGGIAGSTVTLTNSGVVKSPDDGVYGRARAYANASGLNVKGSTGTGGVATASVVITNSGAVTTTKTAGVGVGGYTKAQADVNVATFTAKAGTASATTTLNNSAAVTSLGDGVWGRSNAYADANGGTGTGGSATGGIAIANTSATNSAALTVTGNGHQGVDVRSNASAGANGFVALAGTASATTTTNNTGTVTSAGDGLFGSATSNAIAQGQNTKGASGTGGTAVASITATNSKAITVTGNGHEGIDQQTFANAFGGGYTAVGGQATATTLITNSNTGTIVSTGNGIQGFSTALADATTSKGSKGNATAGTASATSSINNAANITSSGGFGILGISYAGPNALGYNAYAGKGVALTPISNSGTLFTFLDSVSGTAIAVDNAYATGAKGKAVGGNSSATVTITNNGILSDKILDAISGISLGASNASGYTAKAGTVTANTTINNTAPSITSYYGNGILGISADSAIAVGKYVKGSTATGGTAVSGVTINNSSTIAAGSILIGGAGIRGASASAATALGYTAIGGTATATTLISNTGAINAYGPSLLLGDGIDGVALSDASAVGGFGLGAFNPTASATAGTAKATVTITNTSTAPINAYFGNGIFGLSTAIASAVGFHAYGGTATATTTINNAATIRSDAGIAGFAAAIAIGIGSPLPEPGIGKGGTASATVAISNSGLINATNGFGGGYGIIGGTYAVAGAFGRQATGGVAVANTTITSNGPTILAGTGGILGSATALSDGIGVYGIKGLAKGGSATAGATITNVANIYSGYGAGIAAVATASANGLLLTIVPPFVAGYGNGVGGTASATATITNSAPITTSGSHAPGLVAVSYASANGSLTGGVVSAVSSISNTGAKIVTYGSFSPGIVQLSTVSSDGGYKGGTATTSTTVNNTAIIIATGRNSGGIIAGTYAYANASVNGFYRAGAAAGSASASTTVNNSGFISVTGPGIFANSQAYANGWKGGNATATTVVNSSGPKIITYGSGGVGIAAYSTAGAGGLNGTAAASTTVNNSAAIVTYGSGSAGIIGRSFAYSGTLLTGVATATTAISNSGNIYTNSGSHSPGIVATSLAYAGSANSATATTNVTNSGGILTTGSRSVGIYAAATAAGAFGINSTAGKAIATSNVTNSGSIKTEGRHSVGIADYAYAVGDTAVATATVTNSGANGGQIVTYRSHSAGIVATSTANGFYGAHDLATAITTVVNSQNITTYGWRSAGIIAKSTAYGESATTTVSNLGATILTYGNHSSGIFASSYAFAVTGAATATTTVSNSGSITTYGSHSPGIRAYAGGVAVGGAGAVAATVTINNSGSVITHGSRSPAITAKVRNDNGITVNNTATGVIKALGWPYTAIALYNIGGAQSPIVDTINNNAGGLIQGNIRSSGRANVTINNVGTWMMQGNSHFGPGTNTVNNTGLVTVLNTDSGNRHRAGYGLVSGSNAPGLYTAGSVFAGVYTGGRPPRFYTTVVTGLTDWNNNGGTISLINGNANQQLLLSGNFKGTTSGPVTSTLKVDANLGGPPISAVPPTVSRTTTRISILGFPVATSTVTTVTSPGTPAYVGARSDILGIAGNVTGVTQVVVNDTNPGLGVYNPVGIPVVIVGGHTDASNFVLEGGPIVKGLFDYDIYLDAPKNVWVLASTPGQAANELPRLITAAQDVWHQEAGVWADRSADLRSYFNGAVPCDPRMVTKAPCTAPSSIGPGVWFRAFGDWSHNGGTTDETLFGKTHSQDVSYHQDIYGMQVGLDFAAERRGYENFIFGLMAGAVDSTVNFASGTSTKFSGGNLGLYATLINGNFFVDALLLADFLNITYNHSTLLTSTAGSVTNVGGHIDMGYRFNMKNNWFWEPLATVDAVWTDFRKVDLPGVGLDLNTNNNENLRGRLGVRLGTSYLNGGYRIEPSVTAGVWHSFAGDNSGMLTSGVYTLNLTDASSHLTYGEVGAAVNVVELGSRWSGFVKGDVRFGDDYWGGSVKGGARFQW